MANSGTRKNIISAIITILLLFGGLAIFKVLSGQKKSSVAEAVTKKERRKVAVERFIPSEEANLIEIDGRVRAQERVNITSKVSGVMQPGSKRVRKGQYIKKGELLFVVDAREASFNLKAQKSSLLTTITQMMPDLKFDYPNAFPVWQQYLNDFNVDQNIKPLPTPSTDQEKYFMAGRNIYNQYYNIKSQETRLEDYNIYAPFSGVVTQVNLFPGALISPGTVLAAMINTGNFEMEAPVALADLKYIKVGQKVRLYSTDLGKEWNGRINRISTQIDPATQNIPLYIGVTGNGLRDDMYLRGEIKGAPLAEVTKLPKRVFISPTKIYVVKDSTIMEKEITPVKRMEDYVMIKGLGADEAVITGSLAGLFAGQKVNY